MTIGETVATVALSLAVMGLALGCLWGDLMDVKNATRRLIDEAIQIKYLLALIAMEAREDDDKRAETLKKARAYNWHVRQDEGW